MSDYLSRYSDRKQDELERDVAKVYRQAQHDMWDKLQGYIKRYERIDESKRQQVADGKISQAEYDEWKRRRVFNGEQWLRQRKAISHILTEADRQAANIINNGTLDIFKEAANYSAYDIEQNTRGAVSFDLYDKTTVTRLIADKPELLPRRVVDGEKADAWHTREISNAIAQGIIQGESIPDLAKRIARDTGIHADNSATRYARTAMTGAQNSGRVERMEEAQEMGIEIKKRWLATLDKWTRDEHGQLDGQEVPVDEPFIVDGKEIMFPGDPNCPHGELVWNCRCTLINVYPKYQHLKQTHFTSYDEWKNEKVKEEKSNNSSSQIEETQNIEQKEEHISFELDDIWEPSGNYKTANSQREFMMENMVELKTAGIKNSAQIREQYENTMMQEAAATIHKVSDEKALEIVKDGLPEGIRNAWFVDADSSAKPKILDYILGNTDVLNSGWNIAYRDYLETIGDKNVTFEQFMTRPITLFRGTKGQSEIASDVWVSFSMDRKIAESFGDTIETITIRPIDTWGSYQTTAEAEILVPKRLLIKIRGDKQ